MGAKERSENWGATNLIQPHVVDHEAFAAWSRFVHQALIHHKKKSRPIGRSESVLRKRKRFCARLPCSKDKLRR